MIETCRITLAKLSTVAKDGLSALNTATRKSRVTSGARLVSWAASQEPQPGAAPPRRSVPLPPCRSPFPHAAASKRSLLTISSLNSRVTYALAQHHDPVGQRQHGLGLGRDHDHGHSLLLQPAHDLDHVVLGADVHATRRLGQDQHLGQMRQPAGQRHLLLIAARELAQLGLDREGPDPQAVDMALRDLALLGAGAGGRG